jgi:hypothetical protein
VLWLLFTADVVPSSSIGIILMMEKIGSSKTSVPTRATRRNIPEDGIVKMSFPFHGQQIRVHSHEQGTIDMLAFL